MVAVPKASAPMAQAEPALYTSSMPMARAATSSGALTPPCRLGGVTITRRPTPAIWAGRPFIRTELTNGVAPSVPPGTYRPAESTGRTSRPVMVPSSRVSSQESSSSRSWKVRMRSMASRRVARKASSTSSSARANSASLTLRLSTVRVGQSKRRP
jgi:hypothetical protein